MDMKLEVVVVPVSDVDLAAAFYRKLGWHHDADIKGEDGSRVVQFTPRGSACSIVFGTGLTGAVPGSAQGMILVVDDIEKAHAELMDRDITVSDIFHGSVFGTQSRVPGPDPEGRSYASLISFSDPDGNGWLVQEVG